MAVNCRVLKSGSADITQYYGGSNNHLGIDLTGVNHTLDTIIAHTDGTVCIVQTGQKNNKGSTGNLSYGNFVKIDHGNGWFTLYAHMNAVYVSNGQKVAKGQEIGYMGDSGNAYGAHLHFEVWKNNARTNPLDYLNADLFSRPTPVESVMPVVDRDENKDQLFVNVDNLRVRRGPTINQAIIGIATLYGTYNFYETREADGFTWYKIADGQWIANSDNWCTIYPKKDEEEKKMINELNDKIKSLENDKEALTQKINELTNELNNLKQNDSIYKLFVAEETKLYGINLKKGETIKYEKN